MLLSSYFVYNSSGVLDGKAIEGLSLVVNLTKHIHVKARPVASEAGGGDGNEGAGSSLAPETGSGFSGLFPHFMWVVRDFALALKVKEQKVSPQEYLERALTPQSGFSAAAQKRNAVRRVVSSFFKDRDCALLVRPAADEGALQQLASLYAADPGDARIRPEFAAGVADLKRRLFARLSPKTLYGHRLKGAMPVKTFRGAFFTHLWP